MSSYDYSRWKEQRELLEKEAEAAKQELNKEMKGIKKWCVIAAIILAVIMVGSSSIVITKQNEYSVIRQFGSIVRIEDTAGISFKVPFIQNVKKVDKEILYYDIASSDVITSDKKTMLVDAFVLWRITDPEKFMATLGGSNVNAEARLNTVVYNAIKNTISSMTQNEVISSRDGKITVSTYDDDNITNDLIVSEDTEVVEIKSLTELIDENLVDCSDYGIEIVKAEVKVLDLPDANKEAVYQRMISERNNVAASYEAQGRSEAQIITNTTDKEVSIMLSEAKAQAESIIAEGEAEYMRILSEAYNDEAKSEFYSFVRALDAAKASLINGENTLILDEDSPIAQIFYNR